MKIVRLPFFPIIASHQPSRRGPHVVGLLLSVGGLLSLAAAVVLTTLVVWLDLTHSQQVPYMGIAVRIVVIGGFFLILGCMMWRVGTSLMAGHRRGHPGAD